MSRFDSLCSCWEVGPKWLVRTRQCLCLSFNSYVRQSQLWKSKQTRKSHVSPYMHTRVRTHDTFTCARNFKTWNLGSPPKPQSRLRFDLLSIRFWFIKRPQLSRTRTCSQEVRHISGIVRYMKDQNTRDGREVEGREEIIVTVEIVFKRRCKIWFSYLIIGLPASGQVKSGHAM